MFKFRIGSRVNLHSEGLVALNSIREIRDDLRNIPAKYVSAILEVTEMRLRDPLRSNSPFAARY